MRDSRLGPLIALAAWVFSATMVCPSSGEATTLRSAARHAGLRVGVLGDLRSPVENALTEQEFEIVVAHGFSWSVIHPEPDVWNFTFADSVVDFATARGMSVIGMHFVWNQLLLDDAASWVLAIDDPTELRAVLREHLEVIHARYGGRLEALTIVNEPLESFGRGIYQNHFFGVLGPDYIAELLRLARDVAPTAKRILNENFIEYSPEKARGLIELVTALVEDGAPVDVVGFQTHLLFGEPDWGDLRRTMKAIGDLGVEVWVTELDAPVPTDLPDRLVVQADRMERAVQTCLIVPACNTIVWWGLHDGLTWLDWFLGPGLSPLLFDATLAPKPSYTVVLDALVAHEGRSSSGRLLRLRDGLRSKEGRRLTLTSRDSSIETGDPTRLGATLRVRNPASGEEAVLDLAPERWRSIPSGFRYRGGPGDPCREVVVRSGRQLEARCRGPLIRYSLDEPSQGELAAELRIDGAPLQCFAFGGEIRRDEGTSKTRGGRFVARNAPAAGLCGQAP